MVITVVGADLIFFGYVIVNEITMHAPTRILVADRSNRNRAPDRRAADRTGSNLLKILNAPVERWFGCY
jgi:hypothetical protein